MIGWQTVWQIAAQRNETKLGQGHLSPHAFEVLQSFVHEEAREAMANTIGTTTIILM